MEWNAQTLNLFWLASPTTLRCLVRRCVSIIFPESRGLKIKQKLEQMLERLDFILGGCVGEGTQNIDRIVALN